MAHSELQSRAKAPAGLQAAPPDEALCCSESEFLARLGDCLRDTRVRRNMSRRDLARSSGISERYIARIETGKGNVSIMLLLRIAHAIRLGRGDAG